MNDNKGHNSSLKENTNGKHAIYKNWPLQHINPSWNQIPGLLAKSTKYSKK